MKYRKSLSDIKNMIVENKPYPDLPSELQPFHYYLKDSGHVIMCVPNCFKNFNPRFPLGKRRRYSIWKLYERAGRDVEKRMCPLQTDF